MTAIVYNHKDKEIAVDGRFTRDNVITTNKGCKAVKRDGVIAICAGVSSDYESLIDMYFDNEPRPDIECTGIVIDDGKAYMFGMGSDDRISKEELLDNFSDGTGGDWALAALDFGCTAKQAIKYAATKDVYTGGKIRVYKV